MIDVLEDTRNEFKVKLNDRFEEEVIAFLNSNGGNIYIGINDKSEIIGIKKDIDLLQRIIKDRIKDNICPSTLGLYDVIVEEKDGKQYIKIVIARGNERPYYIKGMGMTPDSCFIRIGSSIQKMSHEMIQNEFNKRTKNSLKNIISPNQKLTFEQLKIYYQEKHYKINDNFLKQLELFTEDGKYNYVAYLLSDNNTISMQFAKYEDNTVKNIIENEDFGNCSIIKATKSILNKFEVENRIYTKITYPERQEIKMFDYDSVREAVINAIVHNDWSREYSPKFELFSDRLVISSNGGIQEGVTKEEFLQGFSLPKNKELMRVFKDLDLVERMGTGILRILESYKSDCFEFFPNFIRVSFPFNENKFKIDKKNNDIGMNTKLSKLENQIMLLMSETPSITQKELSGILDTSMSTIQRNIKNLIDLDLIEHIGATKKGEWILKDKK